MTKPDFAAAVLLLSLQYAHTAMRTACGWSTLKTYSWGSGRWVDAAVALDSSTLNIQTSCTAYVDACLQNQEWSSLVHDDHIQPTAGQDDGLSGCQPHAVDASAWSGLHDRLRQLASHSGLDNSKEERLAVQEKRRLGAPPQNVRLSLNH